MLPAVIPSPVFLPQAAVKLGRFVVNIERPHEGYHETPAAAAPNAIVNTFLNSAQTKDSSNAKFGAALTSLMSANFSKRAKAEYRITPALGTEYILDNSDAWFDNAVGSEETRRWLEKAAIRGKKIYMIVGIQTVTDARIVQSSAQGREFEGQATVPASLSLAAAGAIVPLAGLVDPDIHGEYQSSRNGRLEYLAPGEQVCALQYRKVNCKWLSSRVVDTMQLSPTRHWSCMEGDRRYAYEPDEDEEDETEDMIQVDLENMDVLGSEWTTEDAGERQIYTLA